MNFSLYMRACWFVFLMSLLTWPGVPAVAGEPDAPAVSQTAGWLTPAGGWPVSVPARQKLADQYTMLARGLLSGEGDDSNALALAQPLLALARELTPEDAQLWWLTAQLKEQLGQSDAYLQALQRYMVLVPEDDQALWQWISARLEHRQTLEARIELVDQLLDRRAMLSEAVQSRLFSLLARHAYEAGDTEQLQLNLREALRLDPSNVQAAMLLYELVSERPDAEVLQWFNARIALLRAQPAYARLRLELAHQLFEHGLYLQAQQQFDMVSQLTGGDLPLASLPIWALCMVAVDKDREALLLLHSIQGELARLAEQSDAQEGLLSEDLTFVQALLAQANPAPDAAHDAWAVVLRVFANSPDQTQAQRDMAWMAGMFGPDLFDAQERLDARPADELQAIRGRGWLALRLGEFDQARTLLAPVARQDPLSLLALARLSTQASQRRTVLDLIARENPGTLAGVMAVREQPSPNQPDQLAEAAKQMHATVSRIPRKIWHTDLQYDPWVAFHAEMNQGRYSYLEPMICNIRVRNNSGMVLAIDGLGGVPERAVILATMARGQRREVAMAPMVVELDRRLRLESQESLTLAVRVDHSRLGLLTSNDPQTGLTLRFSVLSDPLLLDADSLTAGPLGVTRRLHSIFRPGQQGTGEQWHQWVEQARDMSATAQGQRLEAIARIIRMYRPDAVSPRLAALKTEGLELVRSGFASGPPWLAAWIVRFIPVSEPGAATVHELTDLVAEALSHTQPVVRLTAVATHLWQADDPRLQRAMTDDVPELAAFATARQAMLQAVASTQND